MKVLARVDQLERWRELVYLPDLPDGSPGFSAQEGDAKRVVRALRDLLESRTPPHIPHERGRLIRPLESVAKQIGLHGAGVLEVDEQRSLVEHGVTVVGHPLDTNPGAVVMPRRADELDRATTLLFRT